MKKLLLIVVLSVLTLVSYSQDGSVWKVEKYKGEQLIHSVRLKNENIQINEEGRFIAFNEAGVFTLIESIPDSICKSCVSSYIGAREEELYCVYIFDDRVIFMPLIEDCDDFVVYYFRKFKPKTGY